MRWLYFAVILLFAAAVIIFAAQNRDVTTVSFLRTSIQMTLGLLILVVYLLGTVTGGGLLALMRKSVQGALKRAPAS
jgi:putative membrane protein